MPNSQNAIPNAFVCIIKFCPSPESTIPLLHHVLPLSSCGESIYGSVISLTLDAVPPTAMRVCR